MNGEAPRHNREFDDRPTALAGFLEAAGDAPRLLPADSGAGCPLFHALAALQWTAETGLLQSGDRLHAVWFGGEAAAAVVERHTTDGRTLYRYFGPRMEARQVTPADGLTVIDEPFVKGWEFTERWSALAHFFATTQGESALATVMGSRAPEVEHVRRWLIELFTGTLPAGADHLHAAWFATTGAGFLFPPAESVEEKRGYTYVELGSRRED